MKRWVLAATLACGFLPALAQDGADMFTIATLNVDGLPKKVLVVNVNEDGPGDAGTARIGKYLMQKNYDLVMMQEDFNYHEVLTVLLEDGYHFDTWSGDVGVEGRNIDFLHLQNHRFDCDGLMACWKNDLAVTPVGRTAWKQSFGKFSHSNDELVTKGFRRYDVTLRDGSRLTVYNMHMDASDDADEAEGRDTKDKEARMAQWAQLKDDVMAQLGTHPIIIVGDMNSLYGRDAVKQEFIDAINASGRGTVTDVWVEMQRQGSYPTDRAQGEKAGETLDKILYVNPVEGTQIQPVAFVLDKDGYRHDDKPLGDHYPVAATFRVTAGKTGVESLPSENPQLEGQGSWYSIDGRALGGKPTQGGIYIERHNGKTGKHIVQ